MKTISELRWFLIGMVLGGFASTFTLWFLLHLQRGGTHV
jgi:hypothetical protein